MIKGLDILLGAMIIGPIEEHVDSLVRQVAFTRRQIEVLDDPILLKRYDTHLQTCLTKWEKYFGEMDRAGLNKYMQNILHGE